KADEEHQGDDQAGDEKEGFLSQQHIKRSIICFNLPPVILFLPTLQEPFHVVKVTVIPEPTQIPPSTPPAPPLPATIIPYALVPNLKAFNDVVQRVFCIGKRCKRTQTNVKDQVKGVAEMNIVEEAEEEKDEKIEEQKADEELKADEEHQGDDQAGDEKEGFLSQQHIKRSIICFNLPPVILFLPTLQEPFHVVKVTVIPEPTQIPPSTPPAPPLPATIIPYALVPNDSEIVVLYQERLIILLEQPKLIGCFLIRYEAVKEFIMIIFCVILLIL
nr:hypothetical protein [Tanacetum cinerariifolium]